MSKHGRIELRRVGWGQSLIDGMVIYSRGWAFVGEKLMEGDELRIYIARHMCLNKSGLKGFGDIIGLLNGNFAIVCKDSLDVYLAVDHVRSIELLYREDGIIFDDISVIRLNDEHLDKDAVQEYVSAGYVTGYGTLLKGVFSVQAGECVHICSGGITRHRYYVYNLTNQQGTLAADFDDAADQEFVAVMNRLVASCYGRRIVVPLSGGYDSRLIVNYLHRIGFKDVVCYSYGWPGHSEKEQSKAVAEALGYEWFFSEYGESVFDKKLFAGDMLRYIRYSQGCVNRPHVQEFMAIQDLIKRKILYPNTDIIVPGFSFDMLAGSQITDCVSDSNVVSKVVGREMYYWPLHGYSIGMTAVGRIRKEFYWLKSDAFLEFVTWQERIAKFIVNSVRVYEYFGFDWRLPLWEKCLIKRWCAIPERFRKGRVYFRDWFSRYCEQELQGIDVKKKVGRSDLLAQLAHIYAMRPYWFKSKQRELSSLLHDFKHDALKEEYRSKFIALGLKDVSRRISDMKRESGNAHVTLYALYDFVMRVHGRDFSR